jgi:hypothetical protein
MAQAQGSWEKGDIAERRQDYATAFKEWLPLAKQGDIRAQNALGILYSEGHPGIPKNDKEALRWFRLAAEQGDALSQDNLGLFYLTGRGCQKDFKKAARWYRLSADQGEDDAQVATGVMFGNGYGVPQDDVQAYMWFTLAIASTQRHGYPPEVLQIALNRATRDRDIVARGMTQNQIAEAQRLAREWKPKTNRASCIVYPKLCGR